MKTLSSILAVLLLSVAVFAAGSARITLENRTGQEVRLMVDNKFACIAPAGGDCATLVSEGDRYFVATDTSGRVLQSSAHAVVADKDDVWAICDPEISSECD
jgi:hypothetical protein